jgi:hypothetical protein
MNVGDILPDASIRMVVKSNGVTLLTTTVNITDKKVEAREEIKTEARHLRLLQNKLQYRNTGRVYHSQGGAAEWMAGDVGVVRSETYNRRGNMTGYSVLSNLK